jgi:hypothetical protein
MVVKHIVENNGGFGVEVIDGKNQEILKVNCSKIIYAGNKHALKYIYPADFHAFEKNEYAPWVVVNLVMKEDWGGAAFWQNEILSEDKSLLGFVDSNAQYSEKPGSRVLTVYYCFKPEEREMMSLIEERKQTFIDQIIGHIEAYFDRKVEKQDRAGIHQANGPCHAHSAAGLSFQRCQCKSIQSQPGLCRCR